MLIRSNGDGSVTEGGRVMNRKSGAVNQMDSQYVTDAMSLLFPPLRNVVVSRSTHHVWIFNKKITNIEITRERKKTTASAPL